MKKESAKTQQAQKEKKLLASLVSVRKKHLDDKDDKAAGEPAKRARTSGEGRNAADHEKQSESRLPQSDTKAGNALSALANYSDSEEDDS